MRCGFPLSLRLVEEMLLERGIAVSYETIRRWGKKFGPDYARRLRRKQPSAMTFGTSTSAAPLENRHIALHHQHCCYATLRYVWCSRWASFQLLRESDQFVEQMEPVHEPLQYISKLAELQSHHR